MDDDLRRMLMCSKVRMGSKPDRENLDQTVSALTGDCLAITLAINRARERLALTRKVFEGLRSPNTSKTASVRAEAEEAVRRCQADLRKEQDEAAERKREREELQHEMGLRRHELTEYVKQSDERDFEQATRNAQYKKDIELLERYQRQLRHGKRPSEPDQ